MKPDDLHRSQDYESLKPYITITDKPRKNLMTTMFSI